MSLSSHKLLYVAIGLIAVTAVILWARHSQLTPLATQTQRTRIAVLNQTHNLPLMIAQEEQLFEKQGITPEFVPFASSNQAIEAIVRGDIDIGMMSFIPFFTLEQKEPGKLKIFNATAMTNAAAFDRLIVKKDSPIAEVKQLAGKKIGVFPGTSATNLAKDYFKKQDIDIANIEFVQLAPATQLAALESGSIAALYAYEPGLTTALSQGARAISPSIFATLVDENPIGVGIISTKFIQQQPEVAKKTVGVIDEAIRYQTEQESKARAIAKKIFKFDQGVADTFSLTPIITSTQINKAKVKEFAEKLVAIGELQMLPKTDDIYYQP